MMNFLLMHFFSIGYNVLAFYFYVSPNLLKKQLKGKCLGGMKLRRKEGEMENKTELD